MESSCNICRLNAVCGSNLRSSTDSDSNVIVFSSNNFERVILRYGQRWLNSVPAKKHTLACARVAANKQVQTSNLAGCSRWNGFEEIAKVYGITGDVPLLCRRAGEKVAWPTKRGTVHELEQCPEKIFFWSKPNTENNQRGVVSPLNSLFSSSE